MYFGDNGISFSDLKGTTSSLRKFSQCVADAVHFVSLTLKRFERNSLLPRIFAVFIAVRTKNQLSWTARLLCYLETNDIFVIAHLYRSSLSPRNRRDYPGVFYSFIMG